MKICVGRCVVDAILKDPHLTLISPKEKTSASGSLIASGSASVNASVMQANGQIWNGLMILSNVITAVDFNESFAEFDLVLKANTPSRIPAIDRYLVFHYHSAITR